MFPLQVPADSREYHDINRERSALYGSISVLQKMLMPLSVSSIKFRVHPYRLTRCCRQQAIAQ